ncbi:pyridoxamine 5'-phosphate oxidase family protein [Candidatus Entotheonella palauensis]|uniref:pyridoxamine 5'-phosphate oxidase family protein n=1 Tax=Candidatus Entotheonella palauensis TaxID=93172 RepID=UPI000B7E8279|nr:pyridoxamine 5'-phosphate oxidase family protein [Candidatus Entotheonella palauensis]
MPAKMTPQEVHDFLDRKPGWIILSTMGRDGYPHSVPLGYFRLGDDLYLGCRAGTQKVKNIERNPQVSLVLETGSTMRDIKGVMIQGRARVYTDAENLLRLRREAERLRGVPESERSQEAAMGSAYIKVEPRRVISWDYGREG